VSSDDTWARALLCAEAAIDRKASDLVVLDIGPLSSVADYFVICSGRSDTQVQAIADAIERRMRDAGHRPLSVEGREHGQWILMDYADVVVHVFYTPVRAFYDLERLWSRARRATLPDALAASVEAERIGTGTD